MSRLIPDDGDDQCSTDNEERVDEIADVVCSSEEQKQRNEGNERPHP